MIDLIQGLYKQSNLSKNPPTSWAQARNIVVGRQLRSVSNEEGFEAITDVDDLKGIIIGCIPLNESAIIFTLDGTESVIGQLDSTGYNVILGSFAGLNFNLNNPIRGDYIYNFKGDTTIVFWDGLTEDANPPKILNINCLPFKVDANKRPLDSDDLILLKLFPDIGCTDIILNSVEDGGGVWKTGAYYFTKAYVLPDNSTTNYSPLTNPVFIIRDLTSNLYTQIDGGEGDTLTSKSITLTFTNLVTNYKKIRIACVSRVQGIITAFTFPDLDVISPSLMVTLTKTEDITDASLADIITPNASFNRVQTGLFLDNRLVLANLKQAGNFDYQAYANNIKVKWVRDQEIKIGEFEGSYKDPIILFDKKGFAADEVYGFVTAFGLKDGTISQWYHIPGREAGAIGIAAYTDTDTIDAINTTDGSPNFDEALEVDSTAKYFHFFNSAKSTGEMGFWENESETYADVDCSDIKDSAGEVIGNLRNQKVRHHKFPTYVQLNSWGSPFYTQAAATVANPNIALFKAKQDSSGADDYDLPWLSGTFNELMYNFYYGQGGVLGHTVDTNFFTKTTSGSYKPLEWICIAECEVIINVDIKLWAHSTSLFYFEIKDNSGNWLEYEEIRLEGGAIDYVEGEIFKTFQYTLYPGYKIRCDWSRNSILDYPAPTYGHNNINVQLNNFNLVTTTTKAMGVRFEDIHIPTEIASEITCQYFGYLQRNLSNNLKVATTLLDRDITATDTKKQWRVRNFDLGANKPQLQVNYLKSILYYIEPVGQGNYPNTDQLFGINLLPETQNYLETFKVVEKSEYKLLLEFMADGEVRESNDFSVHTKNDYYYNSSVPVPSEASSPYTGFGTLVSLYTHRKDLYFNYPSQKVVIMGYKPVAEIQTLYSGDVHLNYISLLHSLQLTPVAGNNNEDHFWTILKHYISEHVTNSEMRYDNDDYKYAPRRMDFFINADPFTSQSIYNYQTGNYDGQTYFEYESVTYRIPTWHLYNKDYTSVNDLTEELIFTCNDDCLTFVDSFPFRIARSLISSNEDGTASWRIFKANNYYDLFSKDKGDIVLISKYGHSLIIHQKYSTFLAASKDTISTLNTELYIGTGDIFDRPPKELVISGSSNSYAGCQSLWGGKNTKHGYIFWDMLGTKIFIFKGELKEISSEGLKFYLEKYGQLTNKTVDNPFIDNGICIGFDEKENRALFTKLEEEGSFTISYSFNINKWVCNHDYFPNGYYDNRLGNFCLRNEGGLGGATTFPAVYKMNTLKYGKYFVDATTFVSYLDVVLPAQGSLVKFINILWESEVYKSALNVTDRYFDKTITQIMCYDNYRCTGLIDLKNNKNITNDNLRKILNTWMFNEIRDIVINKDHFIINEDGTINLSNLNNNTLFFKKSKFINNFIVVRLQYDNIEQYGIDIKFLNVTATKSDR